MAEAPRDEAAPFDGENIAGGWSQDEIRMLDSIMQSTDGDVTMENRDNNQSNPKRMLEPHDVVLKANTSPTTATDVWKKYVRFAFGKKRLTDTEIVSLKALQDAYYRCRADTTANDDDNDGDPFPRVTFWVSLELLTSKNKLHTWTTDSEDIRYAKINEKDIIQVVPASDECLRDEIKNNGGRSTLDRKTTSKRTKKEKNPVVVQPPLPPAVVAGTPANKNKKFELSGLDGLKERAMETGERWVNESTELAEVVFKSWLVQKLETDMAHYESILRQQPVSRTPQTAAYDQHREILHEHLFVDIVNRLGNGMVDWYEDDFKNRMVKHPPSLSLNDLPETHATGMDESTITNDTASQFGSESAWTSSECDDATTATCSSIGDSRSLSLQGSKLKAWTRGPTWATAAPLRPTPPGTSLPAVDPAQAYGYKKPQVGPGSGRAAAFCVLGNALGSAIRAKGDYEGALVWFRKALTRQETVFGRDHPVTAKSHYDIGTILHEQGDKEGAKAEYRKALSIWKSVIGKEKDTATVYYNIGNVLAAYESLQDE